MHKNLKKLALALLSCLALELNAHALPFESPNAKAGATVAASKSLTDKFRRSPSAEKFNAVEDEKIVFVSNNPADHMLPSDKTPAVRVNPEAPGPFVAMKHAYDQGDMDSANAFADQYVRYMQRVMFEVRELSQIVGEALVRNGVIDEEDWVGVSQYLGRELARNQGAEKVKFRATAEVSLERVKPDSKGRAEIYVFCSVASAYCREMGPDIERVWRLVRREAGVKMAVFTVGAGQEEWLKDFRIHTGLSMPIQDGSQLAKQFRVSFVPSVVVRASTDNRAYLRTGVLSFARFFEFVRSVQGRSTQLTDQEMGLVSVSIGERERGVKNESAPGVISISASGSTQAEPLQKF